MDAYRYNVDNASNAAEKKRARNKLIRALLKYGHFDKAKQINAEQYKCKRKTKLREQDIYTRDKFFCCLTDYLAEPKANQATEQDIKKCMQFFFDELIKENTKLFEYDDAGSEMFIDDMAYIWYKYFSDVPFEQIKPADIIKCRRYGVK